MLGRQKAAPGVQAGDLGDRQLVVWPCTERTGALRLRWPGRRPSECLDHMGACRGSPEAGWTEGFLCRSVWEPVPARAEVLRSMQLAVWRLRFPCWVGCRDTNVCVCTFYMLCHEVCPHWKIHVTSVNLYSSKIFSECNEQTAVGLGP